MGLQYNNLDNQTRQSMLGELQLDIETGTLYISPRLNDQGRAAYPSLLREAIQVHDDEWLASQFEAHGYLAAYEQMRKPGGGYTTARVPSTAHETLAEGEFNRFYCRGLCVRAIEQGIRCVEVYRGKSVLRPRSESEAAIGKLIDAKTLLDDLRVSQGVEPALGIPPGPNSGLTVRLPST